MTIFVGTFIPYEFDKYGVLKYIEDRTLGIRKSIRLVEKDTEHLRLRCPVSGDYLDITGSEVELDWLNNQLKQRKWYRD